MLWLRIRLACNQFGYDLSLAKDLDAGRVYLVNNMTNSYFVLFIQALFHPKVVKKFARAVDECQRRVQVSEDPRQRNQFYQSDGPYWQMMNFLQRVSNSENEHVIWACNLALLYKQQEICKFLRGHVVLEMVKMGLGMFSLFLFRTENFNSFSFVISILVCSCA